MTRLPVPGQDDNTWGTVLNDYLSVEHNSDGTLKKAAAIAAAATDDSVVHNTTNETVAGIKTFSVSPIIPTPTAPTQATNKAYVDSTVSAGAVDATTTTKGIVKLAGDLGGTAALPTVPGLAAKADDTSVLKKANNLSDVTSATTALSNLGAVAALTPTAVKTSAYSAVVGDFIPVDSTSGAVTITLPTAPAAKSQVGVKLIIGTNAVNIAAGGSNVFNKTGGSTSLTLSSLNQSMIVQYAAGIWYVVDDSLSLTQLNATYEPTGLQATTRASFVPGRKTAFAGDSITVGTGTTNATYGYVTQSVRIAGSAYVSVLVNGGVAGDRSDQLLARMPGILANNPDHVHIQIGTNDAGQAVSLATYQTNVAAIVKLSLAAGATVSIGTVPPRGSGASVAVDTATRLYNLWLRLWCPKNNIPLADVFAALADPTTGRFVSGYDSGDGTHPSNSGHLAIAAVVAPTMAGRQLAMPWLVNAVSPLGLISNPLMPSTTGWADQGGTAGTTTVSTVAPVAGDGLPYGNWLAININNSAGGGNVYRQRAFTLDSSKYSAGDTLVLCAMLKHTGDPLVTGVGATLQLTNGGTNFVTALATSNSVNNPGPVMTVFTVPASPGVLRVGIIMSAGAGLNLTAYLGVCDVFNLTTGGLVSYV